MKYKELRDYTDDLGRERIQVDIVKTYWTWLVESALELEKLKAAGVDNWEGYDGAFEDDFWT